MAEIRLGFEHKLSLDQIHIYSDKRFDDNQMYEIRVGLENKLTKEQILDMLDAGQYKELKEQLENT